MLLKRNHILKVGTVYLLNDILKQCLCLYRTFLGLPWWLNDKESSHNAGDAGDAGSIPGSGRCPGGGHGNPFWYFCLENPMDRGTWLATVHGVPKSQT